MDRADPESTAGRAPAYRPAAVAVAAILVYVALLLALRLVLSPFLEIDEAQFVGAVDLRLVYGNSHPPLYNWLVRGALEATGWNWALSVALVRAALLAATYLLVFDAARRLAGVEGGVLAVAAAALLPQVSWMAAHTLAHSILVMAAAAGVVHALVILATRPSAAAFLWLGIAAGIGVMGKFNAFLLLAPLAVAVAADPALRPLLRDRRALLAPLAFAAVAAPALAGVVIAPAQSTGRLEKLYVDGPFSALDVPGIGLDGVLSLGLAVLAWGGVVLGLVALFGRRPPALGEAAGTVRRVLWRTVAIGLAAFALAVLAADVSQVRERYLTPLLMPLPVLAALHLAAWERRRHIVSAGLVALAAVPVGIAGMTAFDSHRFARPYRAIAAAVDAMAPPGALSVDSGRQSLAANVSLALSMAGREAAVLGDPLAEPAAILVEVQPGAAPPSIDASAAPTAMCLLARRTIAPPLENLTGRTMAVTITVRARGPCREGAAGG